VEMMPLEKREGRGRCPQESARATQGPRSPGLPGVKYTLFNSLRFTGKGSLTTDWSDPILDPES
jgi:hypothetical protein